jgi:hypothetical protein
MNETILKQQIDTLRKLVAKTLADDAEKMTEDQKDSLFTHIMSEDTWKSKKMPDSMKSHLAKFKDWVIQNYSKFMEKPSKGDESKWGGEIEITYAQKLLDRLIVVIQMPAGESPETLVQLEKSIAENKNKYAAIWADSVSGKNMKDLVSDRQFVENYLNELIN